MPYQHLIRNAIDVVVEWDLPPSELGRAVMLRAEALEGRPSD